MMHKERVNKKFTERLVTLMRTEKCHIKSV